VNNRKSAAADDKQTGELGFSYKSLVGCTNLFVRFDADMNISYPRDIFSGQGHDIFFLFLHN